MPFYLLPHKNNTIHSTLEKVCDALVGVLKAHNSQRDLKYFLFDKISGTIEYAFYGHVFVNLYQATPVNLVDAIKKG